MITQVVKEGEKNCSVLVKGWTKEDFEPTPFLDLSKLKPPREGWKGLRLDSAVWAVQEKMGLYLWWEKPDGEKSLVWVMESRNSIRLDEGIPSPRRPEWSGVMYVSSFKAEHPMKSFFFLLDFDKQ